MQFDLTTFFLEIVNFLVLLWIMQRLIYRPILTMLDARQQTVQAKIDNAERLHQEAEALKQEYQQHLLAWQQERERAQRELNDELLQLREKALAEIKLAQVEEQAKLQARHEAAIASQQAVLLREAANAAYGLAAAMLTRLASPELTHAIVGIFLEDLGNLADEQQSALRKAAATLIATSAVEIVSAHPLTDEDRSTLVAALNTACDKQLIFTGREDASLVAGLRIVVGERQLHANLADELAFFHQQNSHG